MSCGFLIARFRSRIRGVRADVAVATFPCAAQFLTLHLCFRSNHPQRPSFQCPFPSVHGPDELCVRPKMSNTNYCCLNCRKNYRRPVTAKAMTFNCPNCRSKLWHAGMDFKAPKITDLKEWAKVANYLQAGHIYYRYYVIPGEHKYWSRKCEIGDLRWLASKGITTVPKRNRYWSNLG
jgi:DNA-directed RNA polymerase subunit RPC12/RpoP